MDPIAMSFISSALSFLMLMLISIFTYIFSKKINFPYTVALVFVGLLLVPLAHTPMLGFIDDFKLTPNVLFYVFLPILLFESAYNINYKQLLANRKSIGALAVFGLFLSSILIAVTLYFLFPLIGFEIPFLVCFLFGSLISATDPVAVLSIFKTVGAPRRLALIFEGESIFNDGTALALFLVILGIMLEGGLSDGSIGFGVLSFLSMVSGGLVFGIFMGILFSKLLEKVKNDESVEIGLTIIMAHLTFLLSELIGHFVVIGDFHVHVSGVIATAIAGITLGNYGRYKISPKVEESIERFWLFFAFVANSMVFILLGLILSDIEVNLSRFILPISFVIIVVMLARAVSVYIPMWVVNSLKVEDKIPLTWQHLLSWGSLRGALAVMMVYLIPAPGSRGYEALLDFQDSVGWQYDFSIRDFIMVITIGSIMFTLFVKATTISLFLKKLKLDKLHEIEEFEYEEGKILMNLKVLDKLSQIETKGYINKSEHHELRYKYEESLHNSVRNLKGMCDKDPEYAKNLIKKAISLHALGIEKQYLKDLFHYHEVDEYNFKIIHGKITRQIERIEQGKAQLRDQTEIQPEFNCFERLTSFIRAGRGDFTDTYMRARTRLIITRKVVKEVKDLKKINFGFDSCLFDEIIELYEDFYAVALKKKNDIKKVHNISILSLEAKLADKSLLKIEERVVEDLYKKEIITPKLYLKFQEDIEEEILKDFRQIG